MNKEQYLDQLYNELKKYDTDSKMKHVTEYDYLITDLLEESTMEEVVEKLGTPKNLAKEIATEFNYQEIVDANKYEEPIIDSDKPNTTKNTIVVVVNILFIILAIFYWIWVAFLAISILITGIIAMVAFNSVLTFIMLLLLTLTITVAAFALFIILLNLKRLLNINIIGENNVKDGE